MHTPRKRRVGLALGSGSARGWAHFGVIRALEEAGIRPDLVCGTSIGALVGAAYAAGELDRFEQWASQLRVADVLGLLDLTFRRGLVQGDRLMSYFRFEVVERPIEELNMPFAAIATELRTGAEVWLREGSTLDAVRASIAMPGLFAPVIREGALLVDGGLVNPLPVSLARAMGADLVIAVDLSSEVPGRHLRGPAALAPPGMVGDWICNRHNDPGPLMATYRPDGLALPNVVETVACGLNIMQVRIARSRLAADPPDLLVAPRLAHLRLLDFQRAKEAIEEGRRSVERIAHALPLIGAEMN